MVACRDKHDLPDGVRWRRVVEFAGGEWQDLSDGTFIQNVFAYYLSLSCNHCQAPICVQSCPSQAMFQDGHGIVAIDHEKCLGCQYCAWVCPYSAPQFDPLQGQMTKCDFCREELEKNQPPACVAASADVLSISPGAPSMFMALTTPSSTNAENWNSS